ncbi:TPA: HNH endonuclease, partial [Klebsiella pneumoniae]|nr:HNH endonuclease [Klebsiella pneumoniae]
SSLNLLGNLALVSVSSNSKFSNSLPRAKAENFKDTIELQSPKLKRMAEITRNTNWDDQQITAHHEAMVTLLRDDVSLVEASGRSNPGR